MKRCLIFIAIFVFLCFLCCGCKGKLTEAEESSSTVFYEDVELNFDNTESDETSSVNPNDKDGDGFVDKWY